MRATPSLEIGPSADWPAAFIPATAPPSSSSRCSRRRSTQPAKSHPACTSTSAANLISMSSATNEYTDCRVEDLSQVLTAVFDVYGLQI